MRIALVGTRGVPARYGGFETCAEEVGRRLVKAGHQVVVYSRRNASNRRRAATGRALRGHGPRAPAGAAQEVAGDAQPHCLVRRRTCCGIRSTSRSSSTRRTRRSCRCCAPGGSRSRRTSTAWSGSAPSGGGPGVAYYRLAESMAVRWSDALIADAQGIADYYAEEFGAATELIAYGAPILVRRPLRHGRAARPRAARVSPRRRALRAGEPRRPDRRRLPPKQRRAAARRRRVGARTPTRTPGASIRWRDDRVIFLGGVWDQELLDQLYANSLTYLHGHSVGGTNPSLLRAIGAGAATIAFDVNFNRDVLADTGRYFTTAEDVATEIELGREIPAVTRDRGARAQRFAYRYDWDDVAARYERLCERLVAEGGRGHRAGDARPAVRRPHRSRYRGCRSDSGLRVALMAQAAPLTRRSATRRRQATAATSRGVAGHCARSPRAVSAPPIEVPCAVAGETPDTPPASARWLRGKAVDSRGAGARSAADLRVRRDAFSSPTRRLTCTARIASCWSRSPVCGRRAGR